MIEMYTLVFTDFTYNLFNDVTGYTFMYFGGDTYPLEFLLSRTNASLSCLIFGALVG